MKFLCPSCKAKYQIADEKVIGRTVKMKCRQCGHLIEINEAVTGNVGQSLGPPIREAAKSSTAPKVPTSEGIARELPSATTAQKPPPKPSPAPVPAAAAKTASAATRSPTREKERPVPVAASGSRSAAARPGGTRAIAPPKPAGATERKPSARGEDESPRPAARTVTASRLPGVPEALAVSLSTGGKPDSNASSASTRAMSDALAGAFTKAVSEGEPSGESEHPLAGDEWYVGINDVPIGPIRLAEIRDRAARGEVTQECLVWRDGFEDWKPLSAFPELVAVVEEGIANLRSRRPAPAVVHEFAKPAPATPQPAAAAESVAGPVAVSPVAAAPVVLDDAVLAAAGLPRQKIPLAAWLAVAAALALGVTLGLVLIKPEPPKQIIKYVEVPAKNQPSDSEAQRAARADNAPAAGEVAAGDPVATQKQNAPRRVAAQPGQAETPAASASPTEISQGLRGLQGLQAGGPRTGPASELGASSGARQQLDSATLSRTVSRYTASVKRSCWQPALDARAPDAATSARISANIVVASSGKVQSVTVSADPKGYRGLSSCIQARVRNWEFPPAGGPTEFNVPFVFAAQ